MVRSAKSKLVRMVEKTTVLQFVHGRRRVSSLVLGPSAGIGMCFARMPPIDEMPFLSVQLEVGNHEARVAVPLQLKSC